MDSELKGKPLSLTKDNIRRRGMAGLPLNRAWEDLWDPYTERAGSTGEVKETLVSLVYRKFFRGQCPSA